MPSQLAEAHLVAQERLRKLVAAGVASAWNGLPGYDEADVPRFLSSALPLVAAGQRQSVALTEAYLARALDRPPKGVDIRQLVGAAVRNGTPPETVYRRPFVSLWFALATGSRWDDAVAQGLHRATSTSEMDVQLSARATYGAVQTADAGIYGFRRIADAGACSYCRAINGAYVKSASASPLHPHCGCQLEALTSPHPGARWLPDGASVHDDFAVHEHGELGALIGSPTDHFTSKGDF